MKYHDITHDDMKNGDGLRAVLWVAGCSHHCKGCQNPITWNADDGKTFGVDEETELYNYLKQDYVSGITLSGGDPLHDKNWDDCRALIRDIKKLFPQKTVWVYTGYTWEEIMQTPSLSYGMQYVDVLVDGRFEIDLLDVNYPWAGSTNQRVIDVQKTLKEGRVIIHEGN